MVVVAGAYRCSLGRPAFWVYMASAAAPDQSTTGWPLKLSNMADDPAAIVLPALGALPAEADDEKGQQGCERQDDGCDARRAPCGHEQVEDAVVG